jgi:exosome complex exonuclease DIS3/RRP44
VRKRNLSAYTRLRTLCAAPSRRVFVFANEHHRDTYCLAEPGESPNDRNDRAIRVATAWYARVCPGVRVVLLTADAGNRAKARAEGIEVRLHTRPHGNAANATCTQSHHARLLYASLPAVSR